QHVLPAPDPGGRDGHLLPGCVPLAAGNDGAAVRAELEILQDAPGTVAAVELLDVAVDPVTVRPIALDGDEGKTLLADEPPEARPPGVIVGRAVRRLAQQDVTGVADAFQERVEVGVGLQRQGPPPDVLGQPSGFWGFARPGSGSLRHAAPLSQV